MDDRWPGVRRVPGYLHTRYDDGVAASPVGYRRVDVPDLPHKAVRPGWACGSCGDPWPCAPKRERLLAEYTGAMVSLHLAMSMEMADALNELRDLPAGMVYDRFLGWLRAGRAAADRRNSDR